MTAFWKEYFERLFKLLLMLKKFFLASDVASFEKSKDSFDDAIRQGSWTLLTIFSN